MAGPDRPDDVLRLRATLAGVAPGTPLRDGLERILRGRTGALIVLGTDRTIDAISSGGFRLDVPFSATGLRELAKMDGAIILDAEATRIVTAAVHLMSAAAVKCGLAEGPDAQDHLDLDEARRLITALAGLVTASAPDLGN